MSRREQRTLIVGLLVSDSFGLSLVGAAALLSRYAVPGWDRAADSTSLLFILLPGLAFTLAMMAAGGLYRLDELFSGHREYSGVVRACTYSAFAALFLTFLLNIDVSRGVFMLSWGFSCLLLALGRFTFRLAVSGFRKRGRFVRRALIAGTDEHAVAIGRRLSLPGSGWQIVGFLDDFQPVGEHVVDGLHVVGDPLAAVEVAQALDASDIILVPHAVSWEAQRDLVERAATSEYPKLRLAPGLYHLLATGTRPIEASFVPLLSLERLRITGMEASLKTAIDYGLSLLALPAVAALLGLVWLAAKLSDGGPVLERRRVRGLHGEPFDLLVLALPSTDVPARARWAWRLRQSAGAGKLSKLPGILNVLRGGMSLVGPRALPAPSNIVEQPWTTTLMLVRPGITGPYPSNGVDWSPDEQATLDVAYVRGYSLWLDLRLLFASLKRAASGQGPLPASYHAPGEKRQPVDTAATYAD